MNYNRDNSQIGYRGIRELKPEDETYNRGVEAANAFIHDRCMKSLYESDCSQEELSHFGYEGKISIPLEGFYFLDQKDFLPEGFDGSRELTREESDFYFTHYIINERNIRMVEASTEAIDYFQIKRSIVMVGASHITGMMDLYESKGYSACRIK